MARLSGRLSFVMSSSTSGSALGKPFGSHSDHLDTGISRNPIIISSEFFCQDQLMGSQEQANRVG